MAGRSQRPSYGGQAVLEGVMIRGPRSLAVAVRRTDGRIVLKKEPLVPWTQRSRLFGIPFIRGTFALLDAMVTGLRALSFSADVAMEEENEKQAAAGAAAPAGKPAAPPVEERAVAAGKGIPAWSLAGSLLLSMAVVVTVFVMLPDAAANLLRGHLPAIGAANVLINLLEGLLRAGLFVGYIALIARMDAIRRVFEYHGAEHQTIFAFESGEPVTPEAAARYDTAHPRCGTSFVAVVIFVSIIVFSFLNIPAWYVRQALKLLLLPVVAGISYEVIRLAGAGYLQFLVAPGMWLQRLTTRRPAADQIEVAMAALQGALEQEGRSLHRAAEAAGD